MNKPLVKNIFFAIGCIALFVAGLFYVLAADLLITTQSVWLMLAILLSFASSILALLSSYHKEKRRRSLTFKGVGIGLAVLFIVFLAVYLVVSMSPERDPSKSNFINSFMIKRVGDSLEDTVYTLIVIITTIALSVIGLAGQVVDLIFTAKNQEE